VPGLDGPPPELPQPTTINPTKTKKDARATARRRLRISGTVRSIIVKTVAALPVTIHRVVGLKLFEGIGNAPEAAVVNTVSVAVGVPGNTIGLVTEHVGGTAADDGVTLQVSAIEPANPPLAVAVIVEVPVCPGVAMFIGVDANVNEPTVVIVTGTDAEVDVA